MLNESEIVNRLKSIFPNYIGDDAAVIPQDAQSSYVLTKDLLVEDVHFRTSYFAPENLAYKSLHVNLSDIAAMGAKPMFIMLGISIPEKLEKYAKDFLDYFTTACKEASVILIGGDTTKSIDKLMISVTAIGTVKNKHIKYRTNAQVDDVICTIGHLGYAHVGLMALEKKLTDLENYQNIFLKPAAKNHEGEWLGKKSEVTAMMDLSDGLYIDLKRLCQASDIQGELFLDNIKMNSEFIHACNKLEVSPQNTILTGGEDYGLLFTVKPEKFQQLASQFKLKFGYEINHIGKINKGSGVCFLEKNKILDLKPKPFSHFGEEQ